jgi:hypothetical protein
VITCQILPLEQECLPLQIAGYPIALVKMNDDFDGLKALYPNLSAQELELARENLDRYLSLAWEIYETSCLVAESGAAPSLPDPDLAVVSKGKVDSQQT